MFPRILRMPSLRCSTLLGLGLIWALLLPVGAQLQITEVMTCNASTLRDAAGRTPDWIELTCRGAEPLNLSAYRLRWGNDPEAAGWRFPGKIMVPGERLVLHASGGDGWGAGAGDYELPFRLKAAGTRLELVGPGGHVLEIPELPADVSFGYPELARLERPTPGEVNAPPVGRPLAAPVFSRSRGFVDEPFTLKLTLLPSAGQKIASHPTIRFTRDGSAPTAIHGEIYRGPLRIDGTTVIRAVTVGEGRLPSRVRTETYLFPKDILTPTRHAPKGWPPNHFIGRQKMIYGIEAPVNLGASHAELASGLYHLPTVALSMDLEDLLGKDRGIYIHATARGEAWERPVSLEWIDPVHPEDSYQADAGLRIRGGASRRSRVAKHGFRVIARVRYGTERFDWPFFGETGPPHCQTVDLRSPQNHSWASDGSSENTFLRDSFARDTQRDLGGLHTRGRHVHLFLNGIYWGIYQTHERVDARFAARYLGGKPDDYDVIKVGRPGILRTHVAARDGDLEAWRHLWEGVNHLAAQRDAGERLAQYRELQGCDAEGIRDPEKPVYLDVASLIDYMMIILFTGNNDAPISHFLQNTHPNNWFALRHRNGHRGFQFIVHDSEHSLGLPEGVSDNRLGPFPGGAAFVDSNPQWIHQQLMTVETYRESFGDRAEALLGRLGALSAEACLERLRPRIDEVAPAISLHAARWGGARSMPPKNREDWRAAVFRLQDYLRQRPPVFRRQLQGGTHYALGDPDQHLVMAPLYPLVNAPQMWTPLADPAAVVVAAEEGEVHYTTDGSDPESKVEAASVSVARAGRLESEDGTGMGVSLRYYPTGQGEPGANWILPEFEDSGWTPVGDDEEGELDCYEVSCQRDAGIRYGRAEFHLEELSELVELKLRLPRASGALAPEVELYLNGQAIADGEVRESEVVDLGAYSHRLREGRNVLAFRCATKGVSDQPRLRVEAKRVVGAEAFTLPAEAVRMQARAQVGATWSALALFQPSGNVERASAENLVISEIMYHPPDLSPREARAGVKDPDAFEFLEFANIGAKAISLSKVRFIDGIQFQFPDREATLMPGEHLVLAKNPRAFVLRYGSVKRVLGPYAGGLKNGGERLTLLDSRSQQILRFRYDDEGAWPASADGLGFSLTLVDPKAGRNPNKASSWRASAEVHGSPGRGEPVSKFAGVVINEVLTNSDWPDTDAIELHNPSDRPAHVGGWYLTDDVKRPNKWRIPPGTVIPAGGYWFAREDNDEDPLNNAELPPEFFGSAFSLSSHGEEVHLFSADETGQLTGYTHGCEFEALPPGIAFGRSINSAGKDVFAIRKPTLGAPNGLPLLGPVIITEVLYHPEEADEEETTEFVEIWNRTDHPIELFDPEHPEHVWQLKGAKFAFPEGQTLEAGECAVIVRQDPELFRAARGLSETVKIYGPFDGALGNSGERLTLVRPLSPERDGERMVIPMVPVDSLRYNDRSPWPEAADGSGKSLERLGAASITDEPQSWRASAGIGGTPGHFDETTTTHDDNQ